MNDRVVALLSQRHGIAPTDWTAVIGWLMCQQEVSLVLRQSPTARPKAARE